MELLKLRCNAALRVWGNTAHFLLDAGRTGLCDNMNDFSQFFLAGSSLDNEFCKL
jgi:hypothetical protein